MKRTATVALAIAMVLPNAGSATVHDRGIPGVKSIIHQVFGQYGDQAVSVAGCETGGTYWWGARNGQYWGIFQMGWRERAKYGYGPNAWAQARAAYRYFVASGRDWSPWQCKPQWG